MKVKTIAQLNIRSSAGTNNPRTGILNPGFELEVEEVNGEKVKDSVNGKEIESSVWYKDASGHYYWGGGVENLRNKQQKIDSSIEDSASHLLFNEPPNHNSFINYGKLINVTKRLPNGDGNSVNIALLDTGINRNHPDLNNSNILLADIHDSWSDVIDNNGHGTHLSGLICACSKRESGIIGLAPNVKLTIFKVLNDDGTINIEKISKALISISNSEVIDLVNMSFNVPESDFNLLKDNIEAIHNKGIIMVASAGNGTFLSNRCFYPANTSFIFSVGSIKKELFSSFKTSGFYKTVDYFFLDEQIKSLSHINENKLNELGQCSVFTAIFCGLIARALPLNQLKSERNKIIASMFDQLAFDYKEQTNLEFKTLYKTSTNNIS